MFWLAVLPVTVGSVGASEGLLPDGATVTVWLNSATAELALASPRSLPTSASWGGVLVGEVSSICWLITRPIAAELCWVASGLAPSLSLPAAPLAC